jgi:hypothetical protein
MDDSDAFRLKHDKKVTFFDCHLKFLPLNHPFRSNRWSFLKMLDDLKEIENGEFNGYSENTTGLIKVGFANSLVQKH